MTILYYEFSDGTIVKTLQEARDLEATKGKAEAKFKEYIRLSDFLPIDDSAKDPNSHVNRALPLSKGNNSK